MTIEYEAGTITTNIQEFTHFYIEYSVLIENGNVFKVSVS
jgi:hypothetical protein